MVPKFLVSAVVICATSAVSAQHCRYDGSTMIMVDVKKNDNIRVGKIYLLDSAGAYVMSKHYYGGGNPRTDTAVFWKNPGKEVEVDRPDERGKNFSFAKNYQILDLGGTDQPRPYKIAINYSIGKKKFVKVVPVLSNNMHLLCTSNEELWKGHTKPMIVWL